MNFININVSVKSKENELTLVLFNKIYSTPDGIINRWTTKPDSDYKLEILISGNDISFENSRVIKDMDIISSDQEVLDQVISKLFEYKIFEMQKSLSEL
ncbi:MAG TPA: hypothetical protein VJ896_01915 [Bacteroidales bacterium]|nr:hypothetical protein [Bacteroidales bacterium]